MAAKEKVCYWHNIWEHLVKTWFSDPDFDQIDTIFVYGAFLGGVFASPLLHILAKEAGVTSCIITVKNYGDFWYCFFHQT